MTASFPWNFQEESDILDPVAQSKKRRGWGGERSGAGRPRQVDDPVKVTVDLERTDYEALRLTAEHQEISASEAIRRALRTYLRRRGSK